MRRRGFSSPSPPSARGAFAEGAESPPSTRCLRTERGPCWSRHQVAGSGCRTSTSASPGPGRCPTAPLPAAWALPHFSAPRVWAAPGGCPRLLPSPAPHPKTRRRSGLCPGAPPRPPPPGGQRPAAPGASTASSSSSRADVRPRGGGAMAGLEAGTGCGQAGAP